MYLNVVHNKNVNFKLLLSINIISQMQIKKEIVDLIMNKVVAISLYV